MQELWLKQSTHPSVLENFKLNVQFKLCLIQTGQHSKVTTLVTCLFDKGEGTSWRI